MVNNRKDIAAIGYSVEDAKDVCRRYNVPLNNAISVNSVMNQGGGRGRSFAGYILQPGYLPPPKFWLMFDPCLAHAVRPGFSVEELETLLAEAVKTRRRHQEFWKGMNP